MKARNIKILGGVAAMFLAASVNADPLVVDTGTVYLQAYRNTGGAVVGTLPGTGPQKVTVSGGGSGGGEFLFKRITGLGSMVTPYNVTNDSLQNGFYTKTFCIEENEFISGGATYIAEVSGKTNQAGKAFHGGLTAKNVVVTGTTLSYDSATFANDGDPLPKYGNYDAIDYRSAYLMTHYAAGNLISFPGASPSTTLDGVLNQYSNSEADAVQAAIWAFEGEAANISSISGTVQALMLEANSYATPGSYGDVRVLNLYSNDGNYTLMQSQLVLDTANAVPLPGVAMMGLTSLGGLFGLRVCRKRSV